MAGTNKTDEQLAELSRREKHNFDILADRYAAKINRYVARLIGNYSEAEDVTQEVFLKAFINIAGFNPQLKFSSWLYRIAHNESVNYIKKHYKHQRLTLDENILIEPIHNDAKTQLEKVISDEDAEEVRWGLSQLKTRTKEILELYYFEDKSYIEIADILRMPTNSIGPTISRAKQQLKIIIEAHHGENHR